MKAYTRRMRVYFAEMFPLPAHVSLAVSTYLAIAAFGRWSTHQNSPVASGYTLLGIWSVFGVWLILRLMDELKDQDIDRELFPERPVPSGRVFLADIRKTLAAAMLFYAAVHLPAGAAFWTALFVLGYSVLMCKRFFAPEALRKSLIITLISHNPIVPLMLLHGFVIVAAEHGLALSELPWNRVILFVVMLWAPFLAWELARKIRAPQDETAYVTYSRLFGYGNACALAGAIQAIALFIALYFWNRFSLSWVYLGIFLFGSGLSLMGYVRFLLQPDLRTAKLKYYAVAFLICVEAAQILEFGWISRR